MGLFAIFFFGGDRVAVSYRKLWHLMLDKRISKTELEKLAGISDYTMRKLNRDDDVSTEVLTSICAALNCEVQDIVDFIPTKNSNFVFEDDK